MRYLGDLLEKVGVASRTAYFKMLNCCSGIGDLNYMTITKKQCYLLKIHLGVACFIF